MSQDTSSTNILERKLLNFAWHRHKVYSKNASRYRSRFSFLRNLLLVLGVVVVALSVSDASLTRLELSEIGNLSPISQTLRPAIFVLQPALQSLLIILPIAISALLAFAVKFDRGNNWLLLRGSAEVLKSEIYCYRTRIREYKDNRDEVLAHKIKVISERLKGSAVHQAALSPYEEESSPTYKLGWVLRAITLILRFANKLFYRIWNKLFGIEKLSKRNTIQDDEFSDLNAEGYITHRLEDQFFWYRNKAQQLDRQLQFLESSIYFFGGLGTFLAAIKYQSWVAVTVALTGALSNYLDFKRVEATLVGYNRAADGLYDVEAWWSSLSVKQKQHPKNFEQLVVRTEAIIRSEHVSWLQDMQDRLAEMYGNADNDTEPTEDKIQPSKD